MNTYAYFSTLLVITLNRFVQARRNIIGFIHKKMLAFWPVKNYHW